MSSTITGREPDDQLDDDEQVNDDQVDDRQARPFTDRAIGILYLIGGLVALGASFQLMRDEIELMRDPGFVPACNFSILMSCKQVINSEQGAVFGFPNPMVGLIGFPVVVTLGVLAASRVRFPRWVWMGALAGVTFAFALVNWFVSQAVFEIEVLCPWCMVVWVISAPLFWYTLLHVAGMFSDSRWVLALQRWHLVPVVLWYLAVAGIILVHFWDFYWRDFFATL